VISRVVGTIHFGEGTAPPALIDETAHPPSAFYYPVPSGDELSSSARWSQQEKMMTCLGQRHTVRQKATRLVALD
jgi:hypothetical protein